MLWKKQQFLLRGRTRKKIQAFALVILTPANEVGNASRTRDGAKMKG